VLEVRDTGVGMSDELQERIFDPFFSTKETGKGTGLGLATVNAIVAGAGGTISVSSAEGQGSVFTLFFPKASPEANKKKAEAVHASPLGGTERILVVEDDRNVRSLMVKILGYHGYNVMSAENGDAALDSIRTMNEPADLVILDMIMPGMTGKETAEQIRTRTPGQPILFISGYTDETLMKNGCAESRNVDFITKPFDSETLQKKVREILDRKKGGGT